MSLIAQGNMALVGRAISDIIVPVAKKHFNLSIFIAAGLKVKFK